jgi:hypothetical protein
MLLGPAVIRMCALEQTKLLDLEWWISQLEKGRNGEEFEGPSFLRPFHFALLANEVHRQNASDLTIPPPLEGYAARMRLWQSIGLECPTRVRERNPGGRFHPLSPIFSESTATELSFDILEVFKACGTTDQRTLDAIGITLSEILGNCFFHSGSGGPICGLACAQSWPAAKLAQVAVADIGVGIRVSLGGNPAYAERLKSENSLELATQLGVTGKPTGAHAGYGLAIARQLMANHGGNLLMASGDEGLRVSGHKSTARKLPTPWEGTIVVIEWDTGQPLDIGKVYASWPKGDSDDDFFK